MLRRRSKSPPRTSLSKRTKRATARTNTSSDDETGSEAEVLWSEVKMQEAEEWVDRVNTERRLAEKKLEDCKAIAAAFAHVKALRSNTELQARLLNDRVGETVERKKEARLTSERARAAARLEDEARTHLNQARRDEETAGRAIKMLQIKLASPFESECSMSM